MYGNDLSSRSRTLNGGRCRLTRFCSRCSASTSLGVTIVSIVSTRLGQLRGCPGACRSSPPGSTSARADAATSPCRRRAPRPPRRGRGRRPAAAGTRFSWLSMRSDGHRSCQRTEALRWPETCGGLCLVLLVLSAPAPRPALAGGPYMLVGAAEDVRSSRTPPSRRREMDKAKLAGPRHDPAHADLDDGPDDARPERRDRSSANAIGAAQLTGSASCSRSIPFGSSVTPLTDQDRADFAAFCVDVATRFPLVRDFIVGNEPNLNRFWLPQFGAGRRGRRGAGVRPAARDDLRRAEGRPPALDDLRRRARAARRRQAGHGRDTHSPTAFIADLGAAYRASGRQVPIMDAFAFHPYPRDARAPARLRAPEPAPRSGSPTTRSSSRCSARRSTARRSAARRCRSSTTSSGSRRRPAGEGAASTPAPSPRRRSRSTRRRRRRCTPRRCRWRSASRP